MIEKVALGKRTWDISKEYVKPLEGSIWKVKSPGEGKKKIRSVPPRSKDIMFTFHISRHFSEKIRTFTSPINRAKLTSYLHLGKKFSK